MKMTGKTIFFVSNYNCSCETRYSDGVSKKIQEQLLALKKMSYNVFYTFQDQKHYYINNKYKTKLFYKTKNFYIDRTVLFLKLFPYSIKYKPNYVYIRGLRITFSYLFFVFFAYLNKSRIYIEIPTIEKTTNRFVYDVMSMKKRIGDILDGFFMKILLKFIYAFVNFQNYKKLYGKKAITVSNGVDFSRIRIKKERGFDNEIRLLAVALMLPTHGYERIIYGLNEYYSIKKKKRNVKLYLVGDGVETKFYKKLTKELNLNDFVLFYNNKHGIHLDELFDKADIGLGAFGIYKIGSDIASILKIKEYCARGIPFVYGCFENELNKIKDFCLRFSNDNSVIDINRIIEFHDKVYKDFSVIQEKMIDFAKQHYSWEKQWERILHD